MSNSSSRDVPQTSATVTESKGGDDLNELLIVIDGYRPTVPEAVTKYYMEKSGVSIGDNRILTFISLAADKFLAETIYEAKEQALLRRRNARLNHRSDKASLTVDSLEICDLEGSLAQMNVFWRRSKRRLN